MSTPQLLSGPSIRRSRVDILFEALLAPHHQVNMLAAEYLNASIVDNLLPGT